MPLTEIMPLWSAARIVQPDLDAVLRGAYGRSEYKDFPNSEISYPAEGGFSNLFRGLADAALPRIQRGHVVRIDPDRRQVTTSNGGAFDYRYLISTMPLDRLVAIIDRAPVACIDAAAELRYSSLHLVHLVVDRPARPTEMQRVYCADPDVPFHKLVINSNSSPALRARTKWGYQGEVGWSLHQAVSCAGLAARMHGSLIKMGLLSPADNVVGSSVVTLERAYPLPTARTEAARSFLLGWLRERDVLCAGRFGEWLYINSDDALMRGKARADEINAVNATISGEGAAQ
jgi:protoporphyrinogen oxidase